MTPMEHFLARLADPHKSPDFRDGRRPCRVSGLHIEEHRLVNGAWVCGEEKK